jgi:hypothetical protein
MPTRVQASRNKWFGVAVPSTAIERRFAEGSTPAEQHELPADILVSCP